MRPTHLAASLAALVAIGTGTLPSFAQGAAEPTRAPQPRLVEDPLLTADLALLEKLDVPFENPRAFRDATAREVVDAVRAATGIQVEVDRRAAGEAGGWEFVRLDCEARTPRQALDAVASALSDSIRSLAVDVAAGLVVFTDSESSARLAAVRHYDLRPLLLRRDMRDRSTEEAVEEIVDLVTEHVDPETWRDNGGEAGSIRIFDTTLVISASPARHRRIMRFLAQLESSLPSPTILWQVRVVEISNEVPPADLRVVLDSANQLDELIAIGGARVVSAPQLLALRSDPASIKVGSNTDTVEVGIEPLGGGMAFAVEVKETRIGATRSLMLRALDGTRSAGILESGGKRLLVEVVGRAPADDGSKPAGPAAKP